MRSFPEPSADSRLVPRFAAQRGIEIRNSETDVHIAGLDGVKLALIDYRVPLGRLVATEIREAQSLLHHLYSPLERDRLNQLAMLAEHCDRPFYRDPSAARGNMHPLAGALSRAEFYGALVPRRGEHEALRILRACLLRALTAGASRAATWHIRNVLTKHPTRQFDESASPSLAAAWHPQIEVAELEAAISDFWTEGLEEETRLFALAALTPSADKDDKAETSPDREPSRNSSRPRNASSKERPAGISKNLPRYSGAIGTATTGAPPKVLDAPESDVIPREDLEGFEPALSLDLFLSDDEPLEVLPGDKPESVAFEIEQATRHHLEGALLPDTDRTLTTSESALVWQELDSMLSSATAPTTHLLVPLCAGLMLVTGRRRVECAHALANFLDKRETEVEGALELTTTTWRSSLPKFPSLGALPTDWFEKTGDHLILPLPASMSVALSRLQARATSAEAPLFAATPEWDSDWQALRSRLRNQCPRFTETRAIHTLAVQIFVHTGHIRESQWIVGSTFEHSSAAGHYYVAAAARFRDTYRTALSSMGILEVLPDHETGEYLVGAPRAAIRWDQAHHAIEALVAKTDAAVRLGKTSLDRVLAGVHALGAYLAILFGAVTAHRFTAPIATITRRDFWLDAVDDPACGLCVVADKSTEPALDARVCVLPQIFTAQMQAYLRQLERAERLLAGHVQQVDLLSSIRAALAGDGPLWFGQISPKEANSSLLDRSALAATWTEWQIPLPLLRHLFASNGIRFGIAGSDIALQMGHSLGDEVFDACDPDCPAEFARRTANALQSYVEALGFRVIGETKRHDPPTELAPRPTDSIRSDMKSLAALRSKRQNASLDEPTVDEQELGARLVAQSDAAKPISCDSQWLVDPTDIQGLLVSCRSESIGVQRAVRAHLDALINQRKSEITTRRRRPFVPRLQTPTNTYGQIHSLHFDAVRWALAIEQAAHQALYRGLRQSNSALTQAAAVVLLAAYGAGTTTDRLLKLIDSQTPLHAFQGHQSGIFAEVALTPNTHDSGNSECQSLTGDPVALLTALRRQANRTPPSRRRIESAMNRHAELKAFCSEAKRSVDDVLAIIGLARQVFISGTRSAWERGELASVGPALPQLASLMSSRLPVTQDVVTESSPRSPAIPTEPADGIYAYRRLRRLAHELAVGRDVAGNRRRLRAMAARFKTDFGNTSLITLLTGYVVYLRNEKVLADSSSYDYLTAIGTRLVRSLGPGDVHRLDPNEIELALRDVAIQSRSGGRRAGASSVAAACAHLANYLDRFGIHLDLARSFDGLHFDGPRRPGYWSTQAESDRIREALAARTNKVLADASLARAADATVVSEAGILIQMHTALRLGEVSGLMSRDLSMTTSGLSVHVHPIKRRGLKTLASRRVSSVPLASGSATRLQTLLARINDRTSNTGDLLLGVTPTADVPSIAGLMTTAFRSTSSCFTHSGSARGHVARHNAGTAAAFATHPFAMTQAISTAGEIADSKTRNRCLEALKELPRRLQFRYQTRQLGHGAPRTTLVWYSHAVPLMHAQVHPWRGLSRDLEARCLGLRPSDIDRWRTHQGGTQIDRVAFLNRYRNRWTHAHCHRRRASSKRTDQQTDVGGVRVSLNAVTAFRVALRIRAGHDPQSAAHDVGVSRQLYENISKVLHREDSDLDLHYLSGRRRRPRARVRLPRSLDLEPVFESIDKLVTRCQMTGAQLREWVSQNRSNTDQLKFDDESWPLADAINDARRRRAGDQTSQLPEVSLPPTDKKIVLLICAALAWVSRA